MKKMLKRKKVYYGNLDGISGNLSDCEITEEERKKGININDLIEE